MHGEKTHCALIVGKTNSGKTKWCLDLVETEYRHQFEAIVIICPTLLKNKTYLNKRWIYTDDQVYLLDVIYQVSQENVRVEQDGLQRAAL